MPCGGDAGGVEELAQGFGIEPIVLVDVAQHELGHCRVGREGKEVGGLAGCGKMGD